MSVSGEASPEVPPPIKQVVCMDWGQAYGSVYVNRLYSMVSRHLTPPFRFVCYTDSPSGIRSDVECYECPVVDVPSPKRDRGWRKLALWQESLPGLCGPVLFLDLDIVITGPLDEFFTWQPDAKFCVIQNWTQPGRQIGNTSVYRFVVGSHPEILSGFLNSYVDILQRFPNSQTYISDCFAGQMTFWPSEWCCSFKRHCVPKGLRRWYQEPQIPAGARIIAFPGRPNPHEAADGKWPAPWYKRFYKRIRPARWIDEFWR